MIAARKLLENIRKKIDENGLAEKTVLSQPFLREIEGQTRVIVVPLTVSGNPGSAETIERPAIYLACALDGKILTARSIPAEWYGERYPDTKAYQFKPKNIPESVFDEMYLAFDSARQTLMENPDSNLYREAYDRYMNALCGTVAKDMQQIYRLLSAPPEHPAKEQPTKEKPLATETEPANMPAEEEVKEERPVEKETEERLWKPQTNLSSMPEMTYRFHEQIAEHIEFLENKEQGQLRISYPLYCFSKDRNSEQGLYQELLYRLNNASLKKGHMRIALKPSIYAKCANAKDGCLFSACPYIIAAYIRYLKENASDELKRQREAYRKKKQSIDARYLKHLAFPVRRPEQADAEALLQGIKLISSGQIEFACADQVLTVTWRSGDRAEPVSVSIQKEELSSGNTMFKDINGEPVPEEIFWAVHAYEGATRAGTEKKEEPKKAEQKVQPRKIQSGEETSDLLAYMAADSNMYRMLTDPGVKAAYGTFVTYTPVTDQDPFVKAVCAAMKQKGIKDIEFMKGSSNSVPRTGKLCFVNITSKTEFKTDCFNAKSSVILCGRKEDLDHILKEPEANAIYGFMRAERPDREYETLYKSVLRLLPSGLQKQAPGFASFMKYIQTSPLPRTEDNSIAEYIAWLCIAQNRIVFAEGEEI